MSILFVLLTFLLILTVMYFRRPQAVPNEVEIASATALRARTTLQHVSKAPAECHYHPGHTWLTDEGRQNARIGIDDFAANLLGKIDSIHLAEPNRWVRQGQKLCTVTRGGRDVEFLSPVEGVVISLNHEVLKDPNLVVEEPYKNGWLCVIKAPELAINSKNLLHGSLVSAWMQDSYARMGSLLQQVTPALAQDGGLPVKGLLFRVDATLQQQLTKEFFLT